MKTPARSEGSVTFSLGELMKLEDERVAEQVREREANERALVAAKIEEERQARAAEEAKVRADHEAAERRRRAELDELARREAMQKATVEQARLEVDARTRAEERERERQHELALQTARAATPKPAGLGALFGATGLGGGLMLLVTCIVHFGVTQPATDRRLTELELRATTAEHKLSEADMNAEKSRKTIAALEQKNATLELDNKNLRDAANAPSGRTPRSPTPGHPAPTTGKPKPAETACADEHDPMCFSIKTPAR
jgi:colicin import membrane protein